LLPQRDGRQEGEDANGNDTGFERTQADVAEGNTFIPSLDDGKQRNGRANNSEGKNNSKNAPSSTGVSGPEPVM
jgi:hypothetical protein